MHSALYTTFQYTFYSSPLPSLLLQGVFDGLMLLSVSPSSLSSKQGAGCMYQAFVRLTDASGTLPASLRLGVCVYNRQPN